MVKAYSRYTESGCVGRIHSDSVGQTVLWSDDGRSLYSCVGTSVAEINVKTGTVVSSVSCSGSAGLDEGLHTSSLAIKQPARATTIARTSDMLGIGCSDGSTRVVSLPLSSENEQGGQQFNGHRGNVNAISFSADGHYMITGGRDTEIVLWDIVSGSGVCRFRGHKGEITQLGFLESDASAEFIVSSSKDGQVKIWSIKLQICVQTLTESKSEVWSLLVSSGRLFVGSSDKSVYVYRVDQSSADLTVTGEGLTLAHYHGKLDRPEPADGRVTGFAIANGILFAQTDRRVVEMWGQVQSESEIQKRMKRRVKRSGKDADSIATDAIVAASDEYVILPSPENAAVPLRYVASGRVKTMAVVGRNANATEIALGLGDNQIEMFRLGQSSENKPVIEQSKFIARCGHRSGVHALAVSPMRLVSVSAESILVWSAVSLQFQRMIGSPSGDLLSVFFVPGSWDLVVLITKDGHLSILDLNTGSVVGEVLSLWSGDEQGDDNENSVTKKRKSTNSSEVKCATLATIEGQTYIVLGCKPCRVVIVKLHVEQDESAATFSVINSHSIPDDPVSIAVSPKTGKYLAVGLLNCNIDLLFFDSGKHALALYAHKLPVTSLAFSPDEQVLCSGSVDKNIKVWSIKFGNVLKSIRAHDNAVTCLQFVPHSHLVWSGGRDGVVSLWDIDRFERVLSKVAHPSSEVLALAASKDAGMVFTAGLDRFVSRFTRSDDQMFIEEEQEKAMELEVDGEARRYDLGAPVTMDTPTKSSLQSVRLVEKVVEMIEIDEEELEHDQTLITEKKVNLVKFVALSIPPAELQQVVISLPTGHARRLLAVIAEVLELIKSKNQKQNYPTGFPIEACVSAALYLIQAQAKYLIGEPHSRQVLLKLKGLFHDAVAQEIENIGIASASIRFL